MSKDLEQILREGRGKVLSVPMENVMDCVITQEQKITKINRVLLPKDVYIKGVYYDPSSSCFMFILFSEEFDPVPTGMEYPKIYDTEIISLEIAK